jgi:hypothetical protein
MSVHACQGGEHGPTKGCFKGVDEGGHNHEATARCYLVFWEGWGEN